MKQRKFLACGLLRTVLCSLSSKRSISRSDFRSKTQRDIEKLSPLECRRALQHWAACREPNSPGSFTEEHYRRSECSCSDFRPDLDSLLSHIVGCASFDASEYLCPRCGQDERLSMEQRYHLGCQRSTLKKTGNKLKRAVDFFRHFTCSRNSNHDHSSAATTGVGKCRLRATRHNALPYCASSQPELDESCATETSELDGKIVGSILHKAELFTGYDASSLLMQQRSERVVQELAGDLITQQPEQILASQELAATQQLQHMDTKSVLSRNYSQSLCESQAQRYNGDINGRTVPELETSSYENYDISNPSRNCLQSDQQTLFATTSEKASPRSSPSEAANSHPAELETPITERTTLTPNHVWIPELQANSRWRGSTSSRAFCTKSMSPGAHLTQLPSHVRLEDRVEELDNSCQLIHNESTSRLSSSPQFHFTCLLPAEGLLERGLITLRNFMLRVLPDTLQSTLELMYLAVACTWVRHEAGTKALWYELFEDILKWRHIIRDPGDRKIFDHDLSVFFDSATAVGQSPIPDEFYNDADRVQHVSSCDRPSQEMRDNVDLLWKSLRQGKPVRACLEFLDGKHKSLLPRVCRR